MIVTLTYSYPIENGNLTVNIGLETPTDQFWLQEMPKIYTSRDDMKIF